MLTWSYIRLHVKDRTYAADVASYVASSMMGLSPRSQEDQIVRCVLVKGRMGREVEMLAGRIPIRSTLLLLR